MDDSREQEQHAVILHHADAPEDAEGPLGIDAQTGRLHRGNLQVHWPEGNVLIRRGITDALGGVPDYNAQVRIEKVKR